jgi:hypothetical protein
VKIASPSTCGKVLLCQLSKNQITIGQGKMYSKSLKRVVFVHAVRTVVKVSAKNRLTN